MSRIRLRANAKLNLTLDVVGRREDGYHCLRSVMQSVSLADQVTLTKQVSGIALQVDSSQVPTNEDNLAWKAAAIFRERTGIKGGVLIEIEKRIPVSAGLAGGTTDAAAVLIGLNILYGKNLPLSKLQKIGLKIGADLPFCLQGGTVLVEGIGERLTALPPFPDVTLVVAGLKEKVSTTWVYRGLTSDAYGTAFSSNFIRAFKAGKSAEEISGVLGNTLESVTAAFVPGIELWKRRLLDGGAHGALMSGSGPAVFGLFTEEERAREFRKRWELEEKIFLVKPVKAGILEMNGGA
ncbi:MAG: 4-(cytidine 5'-diphospho)-2-C-methyl-D-erythritol kinase [Firmicutes bacterium]|nr:4-(cytidine 5'-diphospho)-2-C-methyl-D-erythritol kinase [Bacillota bacterium]